MSLELAAARWLKYEKGCSLVLLERSPRSWYAGQPDVLGITATRFMLEIEIKRSMGDFRANQKKRHMEARFCLEESVSKKHREMAPKQFWFMVPPKLVDKATTELPDFAGLMTPCENNHAWATVVKPSPTNQASLKLTLKECAKLMGNAGNQIISIMSENCHRRLNGSHCNDDHAMDDFYATGWAAQPDYVNFQI